MMRHLATNTTQCPELTSQFDWDKTIRVPISCIKFAFTNALSYTNWNKVYDGSWDKRELIENDFVHRSIVQFLTKQKPFKETDFYQYSIECIRKGIDRWGCKTEEQFAAREHHILNVYNSMKEKGFLTQEELEAEGEVFKVDSVYLDRPGAVIDRDGRYLYHNGNHRLAIAKVAGIQEIPLTINARHKIWVDFLAHCRTVFERIWPKGTIYQPVEHFDFLDYKCEWSDYRYNVINSAINPANKTMLDIGALLGYFSLKFAEQGMDVTAVELNSDFAGIIHQLSLAKGVYVRVFRDDVLTLCDVEFDCILALNIFHHFLKTESAFKAWLALLGRIRAKEMFFQPHNQDEGQMAGAYRNFSHQEFVDCIIENTHFTTASKIGEENGRPIYCLR